MRIVVLGARGRLGGELCRQAPELIALARPEIDLADPATVSTALERYRPDVVVNAAGYNQVDAAESAPLACRQINVDAVAHLARLCLRLECALVQLSTNYVFFGERGRTAPFREEEQLSPQGVYANSKADCELHTRALERHLIVRTCGLYGSVRAMPAKQSFVEAIVEKAQRGETIQAVNDQTCTPSYIEDVARIVLFLVRRRSTGIFHVTNAGATTWYHFALEVLRQAGIAAKIEPISTAAFGAVAPRPEYSVLDISRVKLLDGPPLPHWQQALATYFCELRKGRPTG